MRANLRCQNIRSQSIYCLVKSKTIKGSFHLAIWSQNEIKFFLAVNISLKKGRRMLSDINKGIYNY